MKEKKEGNLPSVNLPKKLKGMTLDQLFEDEDAEFHKIGNKVSLRRKMQDFTATLTVETYKTGRWSSVQTSVPYREKKFDYVQDIYEMKKSGMKQKDIAFQLGISPSYVSQLLKKKENID